MEEPCEPLVPFPISFSHFWYPIMITTSRFCFTLTFMCAAFLLSGCTGGSTADYQGAKVSGKVTLDGSPVTDASITFKPAVDGGTAAFGKTNDEGIYTLNSTSAKVGVTPGKYKVVITKYEKIGPDPAAAVSEDDPAYDGATNAPAPKPKSLIPEKYSKAESSGLEADVVEGDNDIPFELEK